jgi:hypothetical protein
MSTQEHRHDFVLGLDENLIGQWVCLGCGRRKNPYPPQLDRFARFTDSELAVLHEGLSTVERYPRPELRGSRDLRVLIGGVRGELVARGLPLSPGREGGVRSASVYDKVVDRDDRPQVHVDTDSNPDAVRAFYEIPDAVAQRIRSTGPPEDKRTFVRALIELLEAHGG